MVLLVVEEVPSPATPGVGALLAGDSAVGVAVPLLRSNLSRLTSIPFSVTESTPVLVRAPLISAWKSSSSLYVATK